MLTIDNVWQLESFVKQKGATEGPVSVDWSWWFGLPGIEPGRRRYSSGDMGHAVRYGQLPVYRCWCCEWIPGRKEKPTGLGWWVFFNLHLSTSQGLNFLGIMWYVFMKKEFTGGV